ncbi:MAG: zinc ribbon domain-containing protein, partial [Chloroflexi bacterium]|nr:zinc ribbon domain-containing protein [Chloroflexota bacterium]
MRQCPTCGADNDADARFCGVCGSQLPPAARSIEARQPTRASTSPPRPRASESRPATPVADAAGRGVAATLEPSTMRVEPGGAAKAHIRIVNLSRVVDEFRVEPLGDAAAWTQAEPASISLFPGATGTVTLEVRPPRSVQARAGTIALAIRVRSVADASKEVYQQALVNIGAFGALTAGLVPRTSAGKRSATHELTIENQGNSLVQVRISASDPDRKLDFSIATPTLALEAAQARTVPIVVHARQGLMRGAPVTSPFQVVVDAPGADRITADAAFAQQPSLPSWIGR